MSKSIYRHMLDIAYDARSIIVSSIARMRRVYVLF